MLVNRSTAIDGLDAPPAEAADVTGAEGAARYSAWR
jgi:hypothetical protein